MIFVPSENDAEGPDGEPPYIDLRYRFDLDAGGEELRLPGPG